MSERGGIHKGHRERLKARMFQEGLQGFAPHQALELLLCFAIPQRDVNPLAHQLLNAFGSLSGVLEASPEELMRCPGVGANTAALLAMMPQLAGYYMRDKLRERPVLQNAADAGGYCRTLFFGLAYEAVYLICLDAQARVIHPALLQQGTIDESAVYARDVMETALRHNAHTVVLAHNHPGGTPMPSPADYEVTKMVIETLAVVGIGVCDHIIVADGEFFSMAQQHMMQRGLLVDAKEFEFRVKNITLPPQKIAREGTSGIERYEGFDHES
ncbi:MAG: DNA repair protein RadC [Clostridia bacterium]|nr:DNA repair protein RadC [Clostridia bacterium]